jgi:mRNA interferase MazF
MAITSQIRTPLGFREVQIGDWQTANLLKPSVIKPVFATIEQKLIIRRLGALGAQDRTALRAGIVAILG